MSDFKKSRDLFRELKLKIESGQYEEIKSEFVNAIVMLLKEYDTAIYENRFVVGGAVEHIFVALLRALGFESYHAGSKERRSDLIINGVKFSIKTNFKGSGEIRLINKLGKGEISWSEPTIFLISELGLVYGDPILLKDKTKDTGDAIVINVADIKNFSKNEPQFLIRLNIPVKGDIESPQTVSIDVARSILEKIKSKLLINYLEL